MSSSRGPLAIAIALVVLPLLAACSGGGAMPSVLGLGPSPSPTAAHPTVTAASPAVGPAVSTPAAPPSDDGAGPSATPSDACALLTGAEASAVLGATIADGVANGPICNYNGEGVGFFTTVERDVGDAGYQTAVAVVQSDIGSAPAIGGVGDKAAGAVNDLVVLSGTTVIEIRGADTDGSAHLVHSIALAKIMVGHLG